MCYQKALSLRPDFAEAQNNLGHALQMLGRLEEAIAAFERAIAARPGFAESHFNLGNALHVVGRSEQAIAQYEKALVARPNYTDAYVGLGNALRTIGRLEEAVHAFEQATTASPKRAGPYFSLVNAKRLAADDRHFLAMRELARDLSSLPVEEQTMLHFALGKAFADAGDPQRSFHHLLEGNALKRRQIVYDEATTLRRFERIRAVFGAQLMREKSARGDPSGVPVFISGMPRSGTTLVEQILASHPKVFGAGELTEMAKLAMGMRGADGSEFPRRLPPSLARNCAGSARGTCTPYAAWRRQRNDKLPANFDLAALIHLALPNARMIHVRRDPRDTAVSCFSTLLTSGQEFTYDLAELGRYYRAYAALMAHWREVLPEGAMLEMEYEEIVANLEQQARRMLAHCGLEWHDACLGFHKTPRLVRTASATQVRQPYGSFEKEVKPVGKVKVPSPTIWPTNAGVPPGPAVSSALVSA